MKTIVFDNLVDKIGKPIEVEVSTDVEVSAEVGERARLAGQRFLAMFGK
jgi:hypothetical protein